MWLYDYMCNNYIWFLKENHSEWLNLINLFSETEYFALEVQIIWHWQFSSPTNALWKHIAVVLLRFYSRHIKLFPRPASSKKTSMNNWSQIHVRNTIHIEFDKKNIIQCAVTKTNAHVGSNHTLFWMKFYYRGVIVILWFKLHFIEGVISQEHLCSDYSDK